MKVIIEGYPYDAKDVEDILWEGAFRSVKNKIAVTYVGYYYNTRLKDCVFVLPKVLLEETKENGITRDVIFRRLGFDGYDPKELVNLDKSKLTAAEKDFVYNFSVWIYRAIRVFDKATPENEIVYKEHVPLVGRKRLKECDTLLDVILALIQFNRDNRDYFMYAVKNLHSGYNKINWTKTISRAQACIQDDSVSYFDVINKRRAINWDEELLVIFYSILAYVHQKYGFPFEPIAGYELVTGKKFERYLKRYGAIRLKQIKYKYYSDRDLKLWNLCYAFFDQAHKVSIATNQEEYLLVKNFEIVFEAIIDELVGGKCEGIIADLKLQKDGKRVDHIFKARGLTNNSEPDKDVFYIGDSKYYKRRNQITGESVAKQYTYAKNVVQYNLDLWLDGKPGRAAFPKLRDDITEGYNIIPNFFISATVPDDLKYTDNISKTEKAKNHFESRQYENRLFDRDTLLIAHYDVNFLFVVSLYARNSIGQKNAWRDKVQGVFRSEIQSLLSEHYKFYAMTPFAETDPEEFFKAHFQQLLGKVFTPFNDVHEKTTYYSLALVDDDKLPCGTSEEKAFRKAIKQENDAVIDCLADAFEYVECPLGVDPATTGLPVHVPTAYTATPTSKLPRYFIENYSTTFFLFGCVKNDGGLHREWIFKTDLKTKRSVIYNVRLGDRPGAVHAGSPKVKTPKFVILYEEYDDKIYRVFRVHHARAIDADGMSKMAYAKHEDYFCYYLDEEITFGKLDVHVIRKKFKHLQDPQHPFAPLYLTGTQIMSCASSPL